jgi:MoxR-like ATPase
MFERGLAYKKASSVNWCPDCETTLANEEVINGACWRCKTVVVQKDLEQWYLKITQYAPSLLEDLKKLEQWPSRVLAMQEKVVRVRVDASLHDYALEIVNRTRKSDQLSLGVSPRGTLMLQRAAQARAFLAGRDFCLPDDFKQLAIPVFAHRVVASARHASLQKKSETTENVLREIVESVPVPV